MLRCRYASASIIAGLLITTYGIARAEPRALLELFTSQGCSSCPAADKLLGELANDPSLVAYSRVRGDRQVYTPQIVVNGAMHVLGSDRAAVERMIVQTDQKAAVMSLPVLLTVTASNLSVTVKAKDGDHSGGEVWLCPLAKAVTVAIGRGENHGRTITYHNVVRRWVKLGDWTGTDSTWNVPMSEIKTDQIDAAAVMVQEGTHDKPGIILGAAYTPLEPQPTDSGTQTSEHR
jgi:hypothetical protein